MSRKGKSVVFDPTTPYGIGVYENAKARLKHHTLLQDYEELQKESDVMKGKLGAAKQRQLILAAEVRFLRRRHKYLVKTKKVDSSHELNLVESPNMLKHTKMTNGQLSVGSQCQSQPELNSMKRHRAVKQDAEHDVSPITNQSNKKKSYAGKEAKGHRLSPIAPVSVLNHKGIQHVRKENASLFLEGYKERVLCANDANFRNSAVTFDLNQDGTHCGKEVSLPSRAPIFDLNEISTGDEDFQVEAIKFEEATKSLTRGINEEPQSDLKLSICRNAGESSSRPGKRKISWQDPVALSV